MANSYYAAAVKSATVSWKAFLFGSLDPGSFITVDKPPVAIWVMAVFGRIFGFSSWSMLVPQALAGVGSVVVLGHLVRRWRGEVAGLLAALAFALTPVAVLIFRYNNPDAFLTLLLLLATWSFWSALEKGSTRRLALTGVDPGIRLPHQDAHGPHDRPGSRHRLPGCAVAAAARSPDPAAVRALGALVVVRGLVDRHGRVSGRPLPGPTWEAPPPIPGSP